MLCCASVVVIVSTISSITKCDGVCISCCIRFLVPFKLSLYIKVEFKLLFRALSGKNKLWFKGVASIVSESFYNMSKKFYTCEKKM